MIRRRAKAARSDGADGRLPDGGPSRLPTAPANPTSVTAAPPAGTVPAGGDEASPVVIDELLVAFSGRGGGEPIQPARQVKPGQPVVDLDSPEIVDLLAPPGDKPTQATRAMSPNEVAAAEDAAEMASEPPRPDVDLVPEPTRRSARRSRREAKREAKRERKRIAKHAKQQRKAAKRAGKKPSRRARRQREVQGSRPSDSVAAAGVRVIDPAEALLTGSSGGGPTVRIADDELPDPVYLKGDLAAGGGPQAGAPGPERSTVFIDEDPRHADVVTMDVATSATRIEPRMRERRIAVKRAVGRRRLKWIAIVTTIVLIVVAALAVLGSGWFAIEQVDVDGAVYSVGPALDAVIEDFDGANVLRVDTEQAERDLEAIPWVDDARVTTDFPNRVIVEVRERAPSVTYQGPDGRYRILDRDGRVLDVIDGQPTAYLEVLVTDGTDLDPGQMAPPGYRAAATLVQALTPQMRQFTRSVTTNAEATDIRLLLDRVAFGGPSAAGADGGIVVRFGAATDLRDKLVRLQTALTNPNPENAPTEMIDVSTDDVVDR